MRTATIDNYLNDKALGINGSGRRASSATIISYRTQLNLAERLVGKPLRSFTRNDVALLFEEFEALGRSVRSFNLLLVACRNFIEWAIHNGLKLEMRENAFKDVSSITVYNDEDPVVISEDTFHKLCEKIIENEQNRKEDLSDRTARFGWVDQNFGPKYVLILSLMFYGGLRTSEALSLLKKNVKPNGIVVNGKGNKERFVPLPFWLLDNLKEFIENHKYGPFVFYGETGRSFRKEKDKHLSPTTLYAVFSEAREQLGLDEDFTPHNLRHSFAVLALRSTKRLEVVQDLLGHTTPDTTRIYARVNKDDLIEEYNKIFSK